MYTTHPAETVLTAYQAELARLIEQHTPGNGTHATSIPSLFLLRSSDIAYPSFSVHEPGICIIAQGAKVVILGEERYTYGPSSYLVVSLDLPVAAQVTEASEETPYLCIRINFDPDEALDLMTEADLAGLSKGESRRGIFVDPTSPDLLDAAIRLVKLTVQPEDAPVLAPLVIREILYRVLRGAQGHALRQIATGGSTANRIARVVHRIKADYAQPLRIDELAAIAHMAPSSLHRHFKEITAMSPLQYQKQIRLQEARRILLSESADAADVAYQVGYESPSQFSREYARRFGLPPISDIKRLKGELG